MPKLSALERNILRKFPPLFRYVFRFPDKPFLSVHIDVTNTCNLKCCMCYFSLPERKTLDGSPLKHMPLVLLEKIASQVFPHAKHLALACSAESLMYPHFDRYLQLVANAKIKTTDLITNGLLLNEKTSELLIRARITNLTISMDAATKSTYEYIRKGGNFKRLLDNLRTLNRLKKEAHSDKPFFNFQYVLLRSNIEELPRAIELAKELGAQNFTCIHVAPISNLDMRDESLFYHKKLANVKLDEARGTATRIGIQFICPPNFRSHPPEKNIKSPNIQCLNDPWHNFFITSSGIAYLCSWLTWEAVAGNFENQDFHEIWFGEEYKRLRWEIETGNLRPQCLKCPSVARGVVDDKKAFLER